MSFTFLLGILACCISAFVTINRFGFALDAAWCAFDRIYYDALFGQLIKDGERWEGIKNTKEILNYIKIFSTSASEFPEQDSDDDIPSDTATDTLTDTSSDISSDDSIDTNDPILNFNMNIKILKTTFFLIKDKSFDILDEVKFTGVKSQIFYETFDNKAYTLDALFKILSMIYFCLLLIAVTAAGVAMMFYACLKKQGYLITFMHVLWNVIRFFIFCFFLYGMAYGLFFLILRDLIACIQMILKKNLSDPFLQHCLFTDETKYLDDSIKFSVKNIFSIIIKYNIGEFDKIKNPTPIQKALKTNLYDKICPSNNNTIKNACIELEKNIQQRTYGNFDCGFLKSDLHHLYRALDDASVESRILCALTLSASFFGAIAVYFYLLVIHHYNNELFFDSGKSIFTGFDGFGRGFQRKNHNQDPAYKKRKLRAEIELTSKNEDENIED